jgi:hypothetical protein
MGSDAAVIVGDDDGVLVLAADAAVVALLLEAGVRAIGDAVAPARRFAAANYWGALTRIADRYRERVAALNVASERSVRGGSFTFLIGCADDARRVVPLDDVVDRLSCTRRRAQQLLASGDLPGAKVAGVWFVFVDELAGSRYLVV